MSDENKVSVSEFKNWLSGVLDFQPDDWTPNEVQWAKIRAKIDQLDDTTSAVTTYTPTQPVAQPVAQPEKPAPAARHPRPHGPNLGDLDDQAPVKLPDGSRAAQPKHVTIKKTGQPQIIKGENGRVIDTGVVHEMGVIDTSERDYETSFI